MIEYTAKRILQGLLVMWLISVAIFVIVRLIGDPVTMMLPPDVSLEVRQELMQQIGVGQPMYVQYWLYLRDLAHGDFGRSFKQQRPALDVFWERLPATLELSGAAVVIAFIFGVAAGILAATRPGTWVDKTIMSGILIGQVAPTFLTGITFILIFSVAFRWLPTGGKGGISHILMPAITLGLWSIAVLARITRSKMREVLAQEHVKLARLKGLTEKSVVFKHALRSAAIQIVTMSGLELGSLLGGATVTESVFSWPGIGSLAVESVIGRDYAVVQTIVLFVSFALVALNLAIDISYGFLDPRVKLGQKAA
jgi:peptide/nickel transport system permease protein